MLGHAGLQISQRRRIAAEQIEHVLGGAHRAFDATQRVAVDEVDQAVVGHEHFVGGRGEAFAQRGGLGGDIVGAPGHRYVCVLRGEAG